MSTLSKVRASQRAVLCNHPFVQRQMLRRTGALRHGKHALQRVALAHPSVPKGLAPRRAA